MAKSFIKTIISAVSYIHDHGIVHRDLKLENFLFESVDPVAELKLIDFGLSMFMDKYGLAYNPVGTPYYVAPEVLGGEYDRKCDVWSIGVIAYMLLTGKPPFYGRTDDETLAAVKFEQVRYDTKYFANVSSSAKSFIAWCLQREVAERPFANQLLQHEWFRESQTTAEQHDPPLDIIHRLKLFSRNPPFKRMCMEILAFTLTPEQIHVLRNHFHELDTSGTGEITYADFKALLQKSGMISQEDIKDIFADYINMDYDEGEKSKDDIALAVLILLNARLPRTKNQLS